MTRGHKKSDAEPVKLDCGHSVLFKSPLPTLGEQITCPDCTMATHRTTIRRVVETRAVYRIRCRNCSLSRGYGADIDRPRATASLHVMKRQGHRVDLYNGQTLVDTISNTGEDTLPFPSLEERLAMVPRHQQSLRALSNRDLTEPPTMEK